MQKIRMENSRVYNVLAFRELDKFNLLACECEGSKVELSHCLLEFVYRCACVCVSVKCRTMWTREKDGAQISISFELSWPCRCLTSLFLLGIAWYCCVSLFRCSSLSSVAHRRCWCLDGRLHNFRYARWTIWARARPKFDKHISINGTPNYFAIEIQNGRGAKIEKWFNVQWL